ncbi:MAG: hypothetical protein L0H83_04730, partial [Salinisphaera sp.]|nr:hypothetical protein [Salinisphaera sp.]
MSKYLQPLLESGSGPVCWIEPNGYATRAYAGGNPDWATQAQPVASTLAQANGALNSQVLSIDLAPLLFGQDAEGDDPLDRVEQLLGSDRAGQRALPIVQAVEHTLADRVDLMLRLPSPAALLHHCGAEGALSFDDLDDAAAALAAVIREFSASRVAGLVLATDVDDDGGGDEMQVLAPGLGVARHYRWLTALRVDGRLSAQAAA